MRTRTSFWLVIAAVALSVPMLSTATGLGFLNNTPLSFFTEQDFQLMREAVKAVLEDPDPMTVREWLNPANQYSGKIEGLGAFKTSDGLPCRKLRVSTQARGIESAATYPVCRTAGDEWQLASGKELIRDAAVAAPIAPHNVETSTRPDGIDESVSPYSIDSRAASTYRLLTPWTGGALTPFPSARCTGR